MTENSEQKKAVEHFEGPLLVLAGPGSGKTTVIIHRTKYMIEHWGVDPRRILVITFTKAAAMEMKSRFQSLMGKGEVPVSFGTFHAVFFKILKYAYNYNGSNILREDDRYAFFHETVRRLDMEISDEKEFVENISSEISLVKGERMDIRYYYSINCPQDVFRKIYEDYAKFLEQRRLLDFDDMMVSCYELLTQRPDILKLWQQHYPYIMVDECQDSNLLQYEIIKLLAGKKKNLCLVGDDDQVLYGFRGAKPEIMLNFDKEYPQGEKITLSCNYRCTQAVFDSALKVIAHNEKRYPKEIHAVKKGGDPVTVDAFETLQEENQWIIEKIRTYSKQGMDYRSMGILFRTNSQPRALIQLLMAYNIPFRIKGAPPNIYDHWIARNLISYIRIAMGDMERRNFLNIINRPKRYVGRDAFDQPMVDLEDVKDYYEDKNYVVERLEKLQYDLKALRKMNPFAAVSYIRHVIGYEDYLRDYAIYRKIKVDELLEVLDELQESTKACKTFEEWFSSMQSYKEEMVRQQREQTSIKEGVSLMTFHGAKGLEFDTVFILDANEGIIPYQKAQLDSDIEEERRMFYVAMTRAKAHLHISFVKNRYNKVLKVSRFVEELA